MTDKYNILSNVLNVLAKDVAVDSSGAIRVGASEPQNKRKAAEERAAAERSTKEFRSRAGAAMQAFARAASEETLLAKRSALANLEERAAETEVKMITAENERVKAVFENLLNKQRGHIAQLKKEIEAANQVQESTDGDGEEEDDEGDSD
jgi:hypothetical protein